MIEKLQKISMEIFQNALKTYTLKDILVHKRVSDNNLVEMLSFYPNKGVGFSVRRKTWPQDLSIKVTQAKYKVKIK